MTVLITFGTKALHHGMQRMTKSRDLAARVNTTLGTAASTASTDYATAAQGALAASATQP